MVVKMNCSDFLAKEAMRLRNEVRILLQPKQYHEKFQELNVATIIKFYEDNSKTSPPMKDVVMITKNGERIPKSKILIMDSIKELYARFKEEHPTIQIGLVKFYSFRPMVCVTSQSSNTLNVCVCIHHQNLKLMLAALDPSLKYMEMLAKLVRSLDCENCKYYQVNPVIHRCSQCPNSSKVTQFLQSQLLGDELTYSEWVSKEGQIVMKKTTDPVDVFVVKLSSMLQHICRHHCVSEKQAMSFKHYTKN